MRRNERLASLGTFAAGIAHGKPLATAVREAKAFVEEAIAGAFAPGHGQPLLRL